VHSRKAFLSFAQVYLNAHWSKNLQFSLVGDGQSMARTLHDTKCQLACALCCVGSQGVPLPRAAIPCSHFYGAFFLLLCAIIMLTYFTAMAAQVECDSELTIDTKRRCLVCHKVFHFHTDNLPGRIFHLKTPRNVMTTRSTRPNFNVPFAVIAARPSRILRDTKMLFILVWSL